MNKIDWLWWGPQAYPRILGCPQIGNAHYLLRHRRSPLTSTAAVNPQDLLLLPQDRVSNNIPILVCRSDHAFRSCHPYPLFHSKDLIKADTPYTTAKIARMLQQLEFKLQVELQYKKAIGQMTKLYQADGDKKSRADADVKGIESNKKIQLLQVALRRYRNLHILDDAEAEEGASCFT